MALTLQQWLAKIKKFVPSWHFEEEKYDAARFQAIASIFQQLEQDSEDQFGTTFITQATSPILDKLGEERSIDRLPGELDSTYASRVQRITSATDKPEIKALIDSFLLNGECTILEAPQDSLYLSREVYCSRNDLLLSFLRNYFMVLIPPQAHVPFNFLSRDSYASRSSFYGALDSSELVYTVIVQAVNRAKAFGVMWAIVEN